MNKNNTTDKQAMGRMLWKELHERAYNHNGTNDQNFINEFGRKIPRFMQGCSCHEFWNNYLRYNKPSYAKGKYFEWTVKAHNAVNTKLGKPIVSLQEALEIWGKN